MKHYKNACLNGEICDISVDGGIIVNIGKTEEGGIDLCGARVEAGLIDIHTHGCDGSDTMDGDSLEKMAAFHARNGVTSWLPTTMSADIDRLRTLTDVDISQYAGSNILGFHLEGPFINEKYKGAQNSDFIQDPDFKSFEKIKNVRMVTVAPELCRATEFIKKCKCLVSIGHTSADYDTTVKAIDSGAVCITHIFNAMPPLHHRNPSVIGAASDKNIYVQVICDGVHLHPATIRILYKIFGAEKMVLISDSMRATGLSDGTYELGGQIVTVKGCQARLADGALAGSVSPLLSCVKKAIEFGIPEKDAFKMASASPARLLGIKKGELKVGFDADFIVLDSNLNVVKTVIGGDEF